MEHRHLTRLDRVWVRDPVFFVTTCTHRRAQVLANPTAQAICEEVWKTGCRLHDWHVGRNVIMPDHVHFFCAPGLEAKPLPTFVGKWKEWTANFLHRRCAVTMPLWQEEFFDHVLRSEESYAAKWEYVRDNPVRAGLVKAWEYWPYHGCLSDLRVGAAEPL